MGVLPTKETAATPGSVSSASTATASPWTTFSTPSGTPASLASSARRSDGDGSRSEGLSTNALPQAMALASIQSGTITGKLNGVMPVTTPSGSSTVWTSTPEDTSVECDPFKRCGIPQANSMFSSPRATSPAASLSTFPCSAVTAAARSAEARLTRSRRRKRTAARALSDPDAPFGGGLARRVDRVAHLVHRGQRHRCRLDAPGRVEHRPLAPRRPRDRLTAHPVLELSHAPILPRRGRCPVGRVGQVTAAGCSWTSFANSSVTMRSWSSKSRLAARGLQRPRMVKTRTPNTAMPMRHTVHQRLHSPGDVF